MSFYGGRAAASGFTHLPVEAGLSNSTTFSVAKDEKGLMWFSTKEGIDRYDGTHFRNYALYRPGEITQYGLRRNKFHIDGRGRIWVFNFSDVFLYDRSKERFDKVFSTDNNRTIRDMYVNDPQGVVYLGTDRGVVAFGEITRAARTFPGLDFSVVSLIPYPDGTLLVVSADAVRFFDLATGKALDDMPGGAIRQEISRLGNISSACVDRGKNIYLASPGRISAFRIGDQHLRTNPRLNREIGPTPISEIVADRSGTLWFGTPGKGLFEIDTLLQLKTSYYLSSKDKGQTTTNEVSDIYIDDNDWVWIAGNCISYLNNKALNFQYYRNNPNDHNSLHNNEVRSFVEDSQGNLWVGTNDGISILSADRRTWDYLHPHTDADRLSGNKIIALACDAEGNILAGTAQDGLLKIDRRRSAVSLGTTPGQAYQPGINALLVDGDRLWSSGAGSPLIRRSLRTGVQETFPVADALCICKLRDGRIAAGGHNGLHLIQDRETIRNFNATQYNIGSIFCITQDEEGVLWLASEGQGLIRFDPATEGFRKFTVADGLPSNLVYGIEQDGRRNLWLSTTKGISCFGIAGETFKNYTLDDGLPIKEFTYGTYGRTRRGEIVFGSNNGFIIFHPEELLAFDLRTNLIVTDLKIFNESAGIGAPDSPLDRSIDQTDSIRLKHSQNSLTFEFSSVNLINKANYYRWKLEGFDTGWSPITRANSASYTNLKPGSYRLVIQWANTNSLQEIVRNSRSITIMIAPPFWQTPLAYLLYGIFLAGLIYAAVKFYRVRLSERRAKDKIRSFVNIIHDIRTPLSLIKSPLQLAMRKKDFSDETLEILRKANSNASRLTKLADQLLEFEARDFEKKNLHLSYITVERTLDAICEDFIPLMEQRGIVLARHYGGSETPLAVDPDKFDKIIFNLLSNAVKYSRKMGHITLTTRTKEDRLLISIADDGVGIPKEQQKQLFKRYFRADNVVNSTETGFGIGLMITRELVVLHGGEIWVESALNKGTSFHLSFPMHAADAVPGTGERHTAEEAAGEMPGGERLPGGRRPKILIVEDNDDLRDIMAAHLKSRFRIVTATNGAEALKVLSKTSVDTVVSDVMMPVMDGAELCFEIKNNLRTNHIPVILLTALSSNENKAEGYRAGADIYLEKPVDIDLLVNCILNLLENRKKIKEKFVQEEYEPGDGMNEADKKFISRVWHLTEANLSNSAFSAEDLERETGLSRANLYRKFKELLNKTPLEFIQQYRLNKSVELLQSGNYYVNEIAYQVGFSDPKYFSIVFKKYFGKNASEFLKKGQPDAPAKQASHSG